MSYTYIRMCRHTDIHTYVNTYLHTYIIHTYLYKYAYLHICILRETESEKNVLKVMKNYYEDN